MFMDYKARLDSLMKHADGHESTWIEIKFKPSCRRPKRQVSKCGNRFSFFFQKQRRAGIVKSPSAIEDAPKLKQRRKRRATAMGSNVSEDEKLLVASCRARLVMEMNTCAWMIVSFTPKPTPRILAPSE